MEYDHLVLLFYALFSLVVWRYRVNSKLPPGPPAGLLGNAYHIPQIQPWLTFKKFADQYGPIISLWMFNSKTIVLNDYRTANILLDQRSAIYSSRADLWMGGHLSKGTDGVFITKSFSPKFKTYRTLLQKTLNPRAMQEYRAIQLTECQTLLRRLLERPERFIHHLRSNSVAIIMNVAYGYQVSSEDDEFVSSLERGFELAGKLSVPGKFGSNFFLFVMRYIPEWVPGAGFKKLARTIGQELRRIEQAPFDWAKAQIATGSYRESFVSDHINDGKFAATEEEREDIVKQCSTSLYAGGGDTSVSALTTFFFLMARHPDVQERARKEIDEVLQGDMATHEHQHSLPYVKAMIKEILRWGPVAPLVTENDDFEGYRIPKGARVTGNIWAMAHDEKVYPNPSIFDPERFLGDNQQLNPNKFIFGFGRRICPGLHLAESSIFLNVANILANFIISKQIRKDGSEIEPEERWSTGATSHLRPFPCAITPRAPDALRLLLSGTDSKLI